MFFLSVLLVLFQSQGGSTALDIAARHDHKECCVILLRKASERYKYHEVRKW